MSIDIEVSIGQRIVANIGDDIVKGIVSELGEGRVQITTASGEDLFPYNCDILLVDNQITSNIIVALQDYANSFKLGYLKTWKAASILHTLKSAPEIVRDEVRFLSYLKNCLEMEGFIQRDIELIMGWLYEKFA